ncbi:hypothetical protein B1H10_06950 [candidate division KSB1 bacterium 4484_188]|nr:MAG: hypothetical protein B1H10_06950 [candidate division KSB1 bacterium 4484_188]
MKIGKISARMHGFGRKTGRHGIATVVVGGCPETTFPGKMKSFPYTPAPFMALSSFRRAVYRPAVIVTTARYRN